MSGFNQFTKASLIHSIRVIGESASIGGNQFQAAFDESSMDVTRHMYGDADEVTTSAVCLKSALSNEPRVGETLIRVQQRKTYVITEVQSDVESYEIYMRAKDA